MRKFTFFFALMVAMVTTTFAQVDYTPKNFTQTTKKSNDRPMTSVVVGNETYALTAAEQNLCYVDKYDEVTFTVTPGQEVSFVVNTSASWIHNAVFIDFDKNGFTTGVTDQWKPAGDLVAYSFYNNGSSSDENGWNSVGQAISGKNRNRPAIPSYTIPEDATPGEYRIRFTQDWCSIDPDGDADGRFSDFYDNRGAILDAKLVVSGAATAKVEYTYIFNGATIGNASYTAFVGDAYPEPVNVPFGYYAETPAGVVEGDVAKEIECVVKLPFEAAESVDDIEKWYKVSIKATEPHYFQYFDGQETVTLVKTVAESDLNNSLWAFVGDMENGFLLVNYVAGVQKVLASADPSNDGNTGGNTYPKLVNANEVPSGYTTKWFVKESPDYANGFFVAKESIDGACFNLRDGKLAYWTGGADNGSTVYVYEAEPVIPEVPVTFEVYALDGMMNPSLLEGTVSSLGYVVFAASDNNAVLAEAAAAPKVGIFDTDKDSYVAEASSIQFGDFLNNGMQLVAVQFDGFNTPGKYKVHAPAGAFTVNGKPSEEIMSAEFTIPAPVVKVFEVESVTPADKEEVDAINKIEIKFTEDIALATDNMGNFIPVNLVDENDNVIELAVSDDTNVWSKVVLTPATPITAAGTYTLDLSQLQLNGGVCEGSYSWTVVEPVIPLSVVSVDPSEAVESFSSITIEFNKDIKLLWEAPDAGGTGTSGTGTGNGTGTSGTGTSGTGTSGTGTSGTGTSGTGTSGTGTSGTGTGATGGTSDFIKLLNSANGVAASAWFRNATVNGNNITFKLDATVKTSGTYTFAVPAGLIASTDDEAFAGQTFTFTVDAAPTMVSPTSSSKSFELKIDENLVFEFSDEIEFASGFDKFQLMVKGSDVVAAEFVVGESAVISGKVLTLNVTNAIVPEETTSYTLSIPANAIVKKGSDKAFAGKNMTYNVKAFQIKSVDPVSGSTVQEFSKISIEFNEAVYNYGLNTLTLTNVADNSIKVALTGVANGKILTLTANETVSDGTYKLNGLGNIVNNSYNPIVGASGYEYTITVAAPVVELAALEATSTERNPLETAINGQYKLQGVKINFGEIVKKYTTDLTSDYGYILDAEGNQVATLDKCMGGNGTSNNFATPYASTAIETPGTYKVVVKSGVILSADGTKEYKGGEFEFTVAERAVEISPSAEDGFCYNETYENVADFSEFVITVKYAKSDVVINNDVKATMKTGETVYEAAVTVAKSGTTQYITLAFDGEFAEGRYTIDVPAGLFTVDGTANEAYAQSSFTYRKPQLEITRDFDTWGSYLDVVWNMPKGAIITIANAESVEVDETKVATIAVGESVYNSTLSWYYDNWSNAYYIELTFEDFFAEDFEFVKGDYTFTLPAGLYTVNGVANEEAVKAYTYGDPIIEEFTVTNVLPASGSTLESIDAISISFSNNAKPDFLPVTCGDKTYYFVPMSGVYVPVDLMSYEPIVLTEPGTYTLDLSELNGLTGNKVFSWTIADPTAIEDIDAEVENDVIYDLTGHKIEKITKPGIYIVNGKKILVK